MNISQHFTTFVVVVVGPTGSQTIFQDVRTQNIFRPFKILNLKELRLFIGTLELSQGKEPVRMYVVACKEFGDFLYLNTNKKLTHIGSFDPYFCCMSCDCLFAILTDRLAVTHRPKFVKLTLSFIFSHLSVVCVK